MESLAYIHSCLEYQKSFQSQYYWERLSHQKPSINTSAKVYHCENWWDLKLFSDSQKSKMAR